MLHQNNRLSLSLDQVHYNANVPFDLVDYFYTLLSSISIIISIPIIPLSLTLSHINLLKMMSYHNKYNMNLTPTRTRFKLVYYTSSSIFINKANNIVKMVVLTQKLLDIFDVVVKHSQPLEQ